MRLAIFSCFLLICFTVFSCSHNPYENFQEIHPGSDKADVLDKVGSPLRAYFKDGKNIWTYRFFSRSQNSVVYKEIVLDNEKVLEVRDAKEIDIRELEKKEKMVEQSLRETIKAREPKDSQITAKPKVDASILDETSKKKSNENFKPVESND